MPVRRLVFAPGAGSGHPSGWTWSDCGLMRGRRTWATMVSRLLEASIASKWTTDHIA